MSAYDDTRHWYEVREVVARFDGAAKFENAVDAVEESGVDRADISMIASHDAVKKKLGHLYKPLADVDDDASAPQTIFDDRHDVAVDRAAAIGLPVYIGGAGAGLAVVASGGTLAFAALIAAAGAAAGAGIGALVAHAIGKHHADFMENQLAMGSLLLWVRVHSEDQERQMIDLLKKAGGQDVHAHSIARYWDEDDVPLDDFDPNPFLDRGPF